MSNLFTSIDCPPQLDEFVRLGKDTNSITTGLTNLHYLPGTPGWKAVINPQTPLDKAFQIYSLNLCVLNNFKEEPRPDTIESNDLRWKQRDIAWKSAASWLIANSDIIKNETKEKQKDLVKLMPEAIRIQCSHELPPGLESEFPKDTKNLRRLVDLHKLTDSLQHIGLNIKIKAVALALGDAITMPNIQTPKDYGSLDSLIKTGLSVQNNNTQLGLLI